MKILTTGAAGFIGFHTSKALLERGDTVIGFDNFNEYYDPDLKQRRNEILEQYENFTMVRGDLKNKNDLEQAFDLLTASGSRIPDPGTRVCHLAAQAGVRHSVEHPDEFISDNIHGFNNVIELVKERQAGGLIYASTSSVYGDNKEMPFKEDHKTDQPKSLYGMTKKANELQAYVYHSLFGVHSTGLRFFTVYGPWGRPDMALFLFANWITNDEPLNIFGNGEMRRDFTYVEDIVQGIIGAIDKNYEYEIFNLAGGKTEELMDYVKELEKALGKEGKKNFMPMQLGDVVETKADISKAQKMIGYNPQTPISKGIPQFVEWYKEYYNID